MKLFFIYCILVLAGAGLVTFYNNRDAWHALVIGIGCYVWATFMIRNKDSE